jgi:type II secretory pathway predicted ATPase ExeA
MMFEQMQQLIQTSYYDRKITPVFIIDEAQSLSNAVLEDLRMIFSFRMDSENPFIAVLAGGPGIRRKLQMSANQALRQRMTGNYQMVGLSRSETGIYIKSRLTLAGAPEPEMFTEAAVAQIFASTGGALRLINNLASASLAYACSCSKNVIDEEVVYQADRDIEI